LVLKPALVLSEARLVKLPLWLLAASLSIGCASLGQILLKIGVRHGAVPSDPARHPLGVLTAVFHPFVTAGILAFAMSMLLWIVAINAQQLSFVYPMAAFGYVIVTIASVRFFGETVTPWKVIGIGLIVLGVVVLNAGGQPAPSPAPPVAVSRE
jgi:uncharacterized membrane protein